MLERIFIQPTGKEVLKVHMNKRQKQIVLVSTLLVCLMGAFPPWVFVDNENVAHNMGYAPIWLPPSARQQDSAEFFGIKVQLDVRTQTANTIDFLRLSLQIAIAISLAGGAFVLTRKATA